MTTRREFLVGVAGLAGCAGEIVRDAAPSGLRVWDLHGHLSGVPGATAEERVDFLLACADRLGIERLCLLWASPFSTPDPAPAELTRNHDEVYRAVEKAKGRLLGFVYLNPNHLEFSLRELDRCVRDGPLVGVKLWCAKRCREAELDPIIRRAGELRAVIYQHTWFKATGNMPGESTPLDLVELAARHPGVPIVCGHAGGDWERGIRAVRAAKNVVLEAAGFDPCAGAVEMAVRELGAERVVYGSDVGGRTFASQLARVVGAAIPEAAKRLVLGGNLRRLLGPILAAKGLS
jgi:hypothetical protein